MSLKRQKTLTGYTEFMLSSLGKLDR